MASYPLPGGSCIRSKYIVDFQKKYFDPIVVTSPFSYDIEQLRLGVRRITNGVPYFHSISHTYLLPSSIRTCPGIGALIRKWHMKKFQRFIFNTIEETCPDIIHAISPFKVGLPAFISARKYNLPFVYEVRAFEEDGRADLGEIKQNGLRHKWTRYAETKLMKRADSVITVSEAMKNHIVSRGVSKKKVFLVPNGVDTRRFAVRPKDKKLLKKFNLEGYVILGMTSIKPLERADLSIRALPNILSKYNKVRLILMCDWPPIKAELISLCNQYGVNDYVTFLDRVDHSEISMYLSIMDVLLIPRERTRYNTATPLKPLEAMSMGKVVLGSDVDGLTEVIRHCFNGFLFKAGNINDLVEKCIIICKDEKLRHRVGCDAKNWVSSERSWTKVVNIYKDIYKQVMEQTVK